jgi:hypothetical protein
MIAVDESKLQIKVLTQDAESVCQPSTLAATFISFDLEPDQETVPCRLRVMRRLAVRLIECW